MSHLKSQDLHTFIFIVNHKPVVISKIIFCEHMLMYVFLQKTKAKYPIIKLIYSNLLFRHLIKLSAFSQIIDCSQ